MINRMDIHNFKSIREMNVECSDLNVFIGVNSSGKSSILQSLLFGLQNIHENCGLNGCFVELGKSFGGGLFEFRENISDGRIFRLFFCQDGAIQFLNGFVKKTQDTPQQEKTKARNIMKKIKR